MYIDPGTQADVAWNIIPVNLDSGRVMDEVRIICGLIDPEYDLALVEALYTDIARLFRGEYPGYRACNTEYHDLKHTTDTLLAMARLLHGATVRGVHFAERSVVLALASAFFHDTGYIQDRDDSEGTGAKYTLTHISRSIQFTSRYLQEHGRTADDFIFCRNCLSCTGFSTKIEEIPFQSKEEQLAGWMLGTADLLGQMADRVYLEKLLFLYREFREGNIPGFGSEQDLLRNTLGFFAVTDRKMREELGNVQEYMPLHFSSRWGLDCNPYLSGIQRNKEYLRQMIQKSGDGYRDYLRRGGLVRKLQTEES